MSSSPEYFLRISLRRVLIGLVVAVLVAALVPASVLLDRQLVGALEERARTELASAQLILEDRFANQAGARMMHAREIAKSRPIALALNRGDSLQAVAGATEMSAAFKGERPALVAGDGRSLVGPTIPAAMVETARAGGMPVEIVQHGDALATVALAPVMMNGHWVGAAGIWVPLGTEEATLLSALTRTDVLITGADRRLVAYTGSAEAAMGLVERLARVEALPGAQEVALGATRYFVSAATLPGGAHVLFVRSAASATMMVPALHRAAALALGSGLLLALIGGMWASRAIDHPVVALSVAAERVAAGNLRAPLPRSRITELDRLSQSVVAMRDGLASRIEALDAANRELAERQERLGTLQAELIQRDRRSSTTVLLVQLAHEIRNPVAGVRNALELLRRHVKGDAEATEFAELAIDELLRMHDLAERMLDVHRPRADVTTCDAAHVVRDVVAVTRLASAADGVTVEAALNGAAPAAIAPDALKQVLLNLVQNARDALSGKGRIVLRARATPGGAAIEVDDDGPGIAEHDLPRLFDAFFTTKAEVHGVGLGLYIAQGIVRGCGGRLAASNLTTGGARFAILVPAPGAPTSAGNGARA